MLCFFYLYIGFKGSQSSWLNKNNCKTFQVTDMQIFGRLLTEQEMISITSCSKFLEGDILAWNSTQWYFTSQRNISHLAVRTD